VTLASVAQLLVAIWGWGVLGNGSSAILNDRPQTIEAVLADIERQWVALEEEGVTASNPAFPGPLKFSPGYLPVSDLSSREGSAPPVRSAEPHLA
jgi:hypothetical protein